VAAKWIKEVQSVYGQSEKTKFACVGYWYVSILMHLSTCREEKKTEGEDKYRLITFLSYSE